MFDFFKQLLANVLAGILLHIIDTMIQKDDYLDWLAHTLEKSAKKELCRQIHSSLCLIFQNNTKLIIPKNKNLSN